MVVAAGRGSGGASCHRCSFPTTSLDIFTSTVSNTPTHKQTNNQTRSAPKTEVVEKLFIYEPTSAHACGEVAKRVGQQRCYVELMLPLLKPEAEQDEADEPLQPDDALEPPELLSDDAEHDDVSGAMAAAGWKVRG